MKLTIDTRAKGFRAIWQDGRGNQGRELLPSEVELKLWLERFDFTTCKPISSDESAARSFATSVGMAGNVEVIDVADPNDARADQMIDGMLDALGKQINEAQTGEHDEESRGSDGE